MTPRTDLTNYLIHYPREAGLGDEDPETVLDRYHTPDYELVNDGVLLDRKRLLDHIRPARKRAVGLRVEVEQALVDGDHVAARYRLIAELGKGAAITTEIYMFGELAADGRLRRAVQATRTVPSG
ncbi:nuclear transport factor 2 family protein [Micromonospora endolithica]|uniref:Nuclear transport factor 2 family protein n=1 Tax=Micromonospora endolithica TaxID=230091 RepID=A0A3A9ZH50_9ACTN|nr:nuclear transport factor 2 family protein [Micromonospora endolithica]RKN47633.1 nuclear transport factor 2 family protein [Micromonospora endolithica]TWJ21297.1 SnoaL-like protein [Micromonospora endolithica]